MVTFDDIIKEIGDAIDKFHQGIPGIQQDILDNILEQLRKIDLADGKIKTTVQNLKIINSIKQKMNRLVLTDQYISDVKDFVNAYTTISNLQNNYWQTIEKDFKPKPLLREIRIAAIQDTVTSLTEAGIGANITDQITTILRQNITTGGSYKALEKSLRNILTDNSTGEGILTKYTRQITTDSLNQYSAQYTQAVSADIGFEWYAYQGSDIKTTRPFCDAMTDFRYFHVSEIPRLLRAEDLYYVNKKTGKRELVLIYDKTGLPGGMPAGENSANFLVLRGGYNCKHQPRPVSESLVPDDIKQRVFLTNAYKNWKQLNKPK